MVLCGSCGAACLSGFATHRAHKTARTHACQTCAGHTICLWPRRDLVQGAAFRQCFCLLKDTELRDVASSAAGSIARFPVRSSGVTRELQHSSGMRQPGTTSWLLQPTPGSRRGLRCGSLRSPRYDTTVTGDVRMPQPRGPDSMPTAIRELHVHERDIRGGVQQQQGVSTATRRDPAAATLTQVTGMHAAVPLQIVSNWNSSTAPAMLPTRSTLSVQRTGA